MERGRRICFPAPAFAFCAATGESLDDEHSTRSSAGRDDSHNIAFSPAPPRGSEELARFAFASIAIPFFSITGTEDRVPELNDVTAEQRTFPFKYMPPGEKYLLVLSGATHGNFGGNPVRGGARFRAEAGASNPHVDSVVIAATTAFWKTTLRNDAEARAFLRGSAFKTTLVAGDQLQIK